MEFLQVPGVEYVSQQQFITPTGTGYAVRIYCVNFGSTTTNTTMTLNNTDSGTTASSISTSPVVRVHDDYTGTGLFHCDRGVPFTDGCKVHTSANFTFATVVYSLERP